MEATDQALPKPAANPDSQPYWDAARTRRLFFRACKSCGAKHFMPRHLCPGCWSDQLEWIESNGRGTVHSFSIVHRAPTPVFAKQAPYVIALIDLDEGPRLFTNIVGEGALAVAIGDRVRITFEDRGSDATLPQFVCAAS